MTVVDTNKSLLSLIRGDSSITSYIPANSIMFGWPEEDLTPPVIILRGGNVSVIPPMGYAGDSNKESYYSGVYDLIILYPQNALVADTIRDLCIRRLLRYTSGLTIIDSNSAYNGDLGVYQSSVSFKLRYRVYDI